MAKLSIEQQIGLKLGRADKKSIQALASEFGVTYAVALAVCNKSISDLEDAAKKEEEELAKANEERGKLMAARARIEAAKAKKQEEVIAGE